MNYYELLLQVVNKTRGHRLNWENTADANELVAILGGEYVLRVIGPSAGCEFLKIEPISFSLETANGQVIVKLSARQGEYKKLLADLWEMIRCDGKSAEEAAEDAINRLNML